MFPPKNLRFDPELEYLILLTRAGLKPLSRWEAGLEGDARRAVENSGLSADTVERRTRLGRRVYETVFARDPRYVDLYRKRYDKKHLRDSREDARFQGRAFGYPSCCVEAFVERPYTPNGLDRRDQEILFHWACPACNTTPGLVSEYRRAVRIWGDGLVVPNGWRARRRAFSPGAVGKVASSLALAAGTTALATTFYNPHHAYVTDDGDHDGFSTTEEIRMGSDWNRADTDGDQVVDGIQLAAMLADIIDQRILLNVNEYPMMGVVDCEICGASINMGYIVVDNPLNGLSMQLYYIDLHALENGCTKSLFTYMGPGTAVSTKIVDLTQLKRLLRPQLDVLYPHASPPRVGDSDGDGLTDDEEMVLGTNPGTTGDGIAVAEDLLGAIARLPRTPHDNRPYMVEYEMDGMEQCESCGANFNMGHVEFVSPLDGISVSVPYVALHTLAHGGFSYDGTENDGEVLPLALQTVLTANGTAHWSALAGDADDDGLTDAEEAFFGMDPAVDDEDGSARPDGRELAVRMATKIASLPEGPLPGETYVIHNPTRGFYDCLVCGEPIDMGTMDVIDPVAGESVTVPYYNLHFMEKGNFATDRDDLYPRVDPTLVGAVVGLTSITGVESGSAPAKYTIVNAPNPFGAAGGTRITMTVAGGERVEVAIYDVKGRLVKTLFDGETSGPELELRWDGRTAGGAAAGAGVYFCRARFGQVTVSRKMTLTR